MIGWTPARHCNSRLALPVTWYWPVCPRTSYALVDSLQEAESLENRFEQLLSPAMRLPVDQSIAGPWTNGPVPKLPGLPPNQD